MAHPPCGIGLPPVPLPYVEAPNLRAIAANAHIAPSPGMILASVQEQPPAFFVAAFANVTPVRGNEQIDGGIKDRRDQPIARSFGHAPLPCEFSLAPYDRVGNPRFRQKAVECL